MSLESIPKYPVRPKSNAIYIASMSFIAVSLLLLPVIYTDVSVNASAIIRPSAEMFTIRSTSSGRIKDIHLTENKIVKKGEILLALESDVLNEQEKYIKNEISQAQSAIKDLRKLIISVSESTSASPRFENHLYAQLYLTYREKVNDAMIRLNKSKLDLDRQTKLYREKVIATADYENFQFENQKSNESLDQLKELELSQWQKELRDLVEKSHELESRLVQIQKEQSNLNIQSPIAGTLQNLAGVYTGSMVSENQELGQISPDTSMIAIAYVTPNQIGLLHKGLPVRLLIDSFNYNQWGVVSGHILDVPHDIKIIDSKPVFEVRCGISKNYLELKNGYKGYLKKGMTLQARFIITRRSIGELLFDKVDDWINPNSFRTTSEN